MKTGCEKHINVTWIGEWCPLCLQEENEQLQLEVSRLNMIKDKWYEIAEQLVWDSGDLHQFVDDIHRLQNEIAYLREETRWRKYPDEKPEIRQKYLVVDAHEGGRLVIRARFDEDGRWFSMEFGFDTFVTHFMPLPKLPEE